MKKYEGNKAIVSELDRIEYNRHTLATLPAYILDWIELNCNEIIAILNKKGEILFVSKSVETILGYKKSELYGKTWQDIIARESIPLVLRQLANKDKSEYIFHLNIHNKQEQLISFECSTAKVKDDLNNNFYYTSILKNLTQHKSVEEMMIRSEKMSIAGQLAAGLVHEIRNPLTSLKGFLQLLQAGGKGKDAYYKVMIDEIDKIETVTSELLFISKPMTSDKQNESIRSIINDVIILLGAQANLKGIELQLIQPKDTYFYCNQSQMKQVFINLVKNAIEAMSTPGTIKIVVNIKETEINIDVIDEGPNIPEDIIHKLTTPFFTTKQKGTGLGLMITKQILEQHEAKIKVIKNKLIGNTFRVILPNESTII